MSEIIFNGKSYSSPDEMPPDVRQAYEQVVGVFADKNQDGMLDIFQGSAGKGRMDIQSVSISSNEGQVFIDGKAYSSPEEMPAEVRQKYEQAIAEAGQILKDVNHNNVPDILEGLLESQSKPTASRGEPFPASAMRPSMQPSEPVVRDVTSKVGL